MDIHLSSLSTYAQPAIGHPVSWDCRRACELSRSQHVLNMTSLYGHNYTCPQRCTSVRVWLRYKSPVVYFVRHTKYLHTRYVGRYFSHTIFEVPRQIMSASVKNASAAVHASYLICSRYLGSPILPHVLQATRISRL